MEGVEAAPGAPGIDADGGGGMLVGIEWFAQDAPHLGAGAVRPDQHIGGDGLLRSAGLRQVQCPAPVFETGIGATPPGQVVGASSQGMPEQSVVKMQPGNGIAA
ncbi:hypothetical protein D3C85_1582220 [compost metagenome]